MKKIILIFAIIIGVLFIISSLCLFSACQEDENKNNTNLENSRFVAIESGEFSDFTYYTTSCTLNYTIYYDRETLVMYMAVEKFNKGTVGFTVMVDENGKPLLYDKEKLE